jgi:hypothetical protein
MVLPLLLFAFVVWLIVNSRMGIYSAFAMPNSGGASGGW